MKPRMFFADCLTYYAIKYKPPLKQQLPRETRAELCVKTKSIGKSYIRLDIQDLSGWMNTLEGENWIKK